MKKISMRKLTAVSIVLALVGVTSFVPLQQQQQRQLVTKCAAKNQVDREWVEKDLKEASKAEKESRDWVAEDMNKVGQAGSPLHDDWIYRGMKKAGEGGSHEPVLRKEQRKTSKKYDAIAKDMAKMGAGDTADWVARDMKKAGNPDEDSKFTTSSWLRDLDHKLDDQRERNKDIRDDMKKTGSPRDEETLRIERDMQKTGQAESPLDTLASFLHDVTYKLDDWFIKTFNQDEIRKDMESGGRTTDQSWVGHDMEMTGKHSESVGSYRAPAQKQELREELSKSEHNKWISKDMQESGDATRNTWQTRRDSMSTHKTSNLVAQDLRIMGSAESNELIRHDMEDAGHPDAHPLSITTMGSQKMGQYKREVNEFNELEHHKAEMPKAQHKRTSWEPAEDDDQTQHKHKYLHFVVRLLKKAIMPWRDWKKL